ncbi:MAG: hypothetical protein ACI8X5_002383 [Planctomycetota bacterium]|jgi:hypothetical protein
MALCHVGRPLRRTLGALPRWQMSVAQDPHAWPKTTLLDAGEGFSMEERRAAPFLHTRTRVTHFQAPGRAPNGVPFGLGAGHPGHNPSANSIQHISQESY